jgi:hypothetical protein
MDYCTIEQLTGRAQQGNVAAMSGYLPQVSSDEDKAALAEIITRVSRRIDAYVTDGRAENYFAPAADEASEITVYGDDMSLMLLPAFVPGSVSKVLGLHGVEIMNFVERNGGIQLTDAAGSVSRGLFFGEGIAYKVTARWGLAALPGDINEAALQLTVRTYRSKDEAFSGVIGGLRTDGSIIERAMPAAVKEALDVHRRKYRARRLTFA